MAEANLNEIPVNLNMPANEKRRIQYQRRKEEDPNFVKLESEKRQKRRQRQKEQDPEANKQKLLLGKLERENEHRQILNDFFDKLFHENKHTFPNPISKTRWENLKNNYLDFLFSDVFAPGSNSVKELMEDREKHIELLQNNPNHPCAGSIIFSIKTLVPYAKDNRRKLTKEEIEWINSLDLKEKTKCEPINDRNEYKREKSKMCRENIKSNRKTANLNLRFMKNDPNRVLSIDEITNNPFCKNFSIREQHKIDLWKSDQNLDYLEKWRKQYEDYVMGVEKLSIEYKENFLKINGRSDSSRDI